MAKHHAAGLPAGLAGLCAAMLFAAAPLAAQETGPAADTMVAQAGRTVPTASTSGEYGAVAKINNWTLGIAGGPLGSTLLQFVSDLAIALNDDDNLRILPIVSAGSVENVTDLLYLRGVDLAMTSSDALDAVKRSRNVANIERRINYILPCTSSSSIFSPGPRSNR